MLSLISIGTGRIILLCLVITISSTVISTFFHIYWLFWASLGLAILTLTLGIVILSMLYNNLSRWSKSSKYTEIRSERVLVANKGDEIPAERAQKAGEVEETDVRLQVDVLDDRGETPIVLMTNGWGMDMDDVKQFAIPVYLAGFTVVTFLSRGHGQSGGKRGDLHRSQFDIEKIIAWIDSEESSLQNTENRRIISFGISYGGCIQLTGAYSNPRVHAIIAACAPNDWHCLQLTWGLELVIFFWLAKLPMLRNMKNSRIRHIVETCSPQYVIPRVRSESWWKPRHILLLHAKNDSIVPFDQAMANQDVLQGDNVDTLFVEDGGHGFFGNELAVIGKVTKFLRECSE